MHSGDVITLTLVGAPNSGKTTLYNILTNSHFKTVNYPGSTVEYSIGKLTNHKETQVIDTPGTYSLFPKSADEQVTFEQIFDQINYKSKVIILVVDSTQLGRQLLLVDQIRETDIPFVVALTMKDIMLSENKKINLDELKQKFAVNFVEINGMNSDGVKELTEKALALGNSTLKSPIKASVPAEWSREKTQSNLQNYYALANQIISQPKVNSSKFYQTSLKIDKVLLHPWLGFLAFFLIMSSLFTAVFWLASPFMDLVETGLGYIGEFAGNITQSNPIFSDFLVNGIFAGFSSVLVFTPQIFILFFLIGILESTGYLSRAATVIDKPFSIMGLSGRSFVPFLSGYACAVPAVMATRNISSSRERFICNMVIPLLTCSARLPVYALLIGFVFFQEASWKSGFIMAAIYVGSMILGAFAAGVLNLIIKKSKRSLFVMELPYYRKPKVKLIFSQSIQKTLSYIKKAGPVIFTFSILIWAGTTFPNHQLEDSKVKIESSYLGKAGRQIEPVFEPLGFDWRVGIGLLTAFAARETFVSTLAVIFNATEDDQGNSQNSLIEKMKEAKTSTGENLFNIASVASLIVFFMIALQCISTSAIVAKEAGGWKYAVIQLFGLNVFAYVVSMLVYNAIKLMG